MVFVHKEIPVKDLGNGVQRQVLAKGGTMMAAEVAFEKGAIGAAHSHPHEQIGYVVSGKFAFTMDGKTTTLEKGDSYYVPSNVVHGAECLEAGILLDIFTPQREDFL